MNVAHGAGRRADAWASASVTAVLVAAATVLLGFWLLVALSRNDLETFESPLILVIARQVREGPQALYGPYGGRDPLVLIHAPLYYHLAGLLAWALACSWLEVVEAAMVAGRALSIFGLGLTSLAAHRIARLDGAGARSGVWAVLLLLAAPVIGGRACTARPDMLGVALQTTGVWLVLSALSVPGATPRRVLGAYLCFALAACTKQHLFMAVLVSTALLLRRGPDGKIAFHPAARGWITFLSVVGVVFGLEELATQGRMSQSVFRAALVVGRIHPGSWLHVSTVFAAVIGNSVGLILVLGAASLACAPRRRSAASWGGLPIRPTNSSPRAAGAASCGGLPIRPTGSWPRGARVAAAILTRVAAGVIASTVVLTVLHVVIVRPWIGALVLGGGLATLLCVIPGCPLSGPPSKSNALDAVLWIYLAAEVTLLAVLARASEGAWINYAIQAVVFVCIITGRALARAWAGAPSRGALALATATALAVLASACLDVKNAAATRVRERNALQRLFDAARFAPANCFFVEHPGYNRVYGRMELVYDHWLYPVFEPLGLAEPRARWLRDAVTGRRVRTVVAQLPDGRIDGIEEPLGVLGFRLVGQFGPFFAYERSRP
jgi:hypothetical protein